MSRRQILPAKLTRPRLARAVPRERLFALLDATRDNRPAICVVGPPGAGKTTLVASWIEARHVEGIWYQVDPGDADLATFFYYLSLAAQPFVRKRQRPLPLLTSEYLADVQGFSRRFFRELLSRIPRGSFLVLDNYQEVSAEQQFHELIAAAANEVPEGVALIIISRSDAPGCYARLFANERIGMIDWEALKLRLDEAEAISSTRTGTPSSNLARLHETCNGWAAGFTLLLEHFQHGAGYGLEGQGDSLRGIFDYFAGQLFDRVPQHAQKLLMRLSVLPRMSASAAQRLTESSDAVPLLEDMFRRRLFIDRRNTGEPVYQFHALLHAFLQDRASELLSPTEQHQLTRLAGHIVEEAGRPEEALPLYLKGKDHDGVRAIVLREAPRLIGQGRWKVLVDAIEALPGEQVQSDRWLMHWFGTATVAIDPVGSRGKLEKAFTLAEGAGDDLCQVQIAAAIIGTYMAQYTHFRPLDRWIAILERKLTKQLTFCDPATELDVQSALLIALGFRQPSNPLLPSCVERVFHLLRSSADINLRARAATYLFHYGATTGPLEVSRRALSELDRVLTHPEVTAYNIASAFAAASWFHCLRRNAVECLSASCRAEGIAEEHGLISRGKLALINRMWLALFDFNANEGKRQLERVERLTNHSHPFDAATLHGARGWIALCEGRPETALTLMLRAVDYFDEAGSVMHSINFRLGLVTTLTTLRQFDAARERIRQVREIAGESLTVWQRVALWAGEASIALEEGDREAALHRLALALAFSRECGEDFSFSNWFRPWMSQLCEEALAAGIELQYVRELIQRYGFSPPTRFSPQWPWPVKIYALGEFQLLLADQAVQFGRKAPRRVLSVLKYILAHGGNGVSLRQVADALWPDVEGDASMRALGVALARLRKLLGGHDVLWVNDERVSLNGKLVWSDSQAFESLVADGDSQNFGLDSAACAQMSAKILFLYRGDFLAADRDEPWALRPRLRLRTRFVRSMASLGTRLEASASWDLAIECYRRGLEVDDLAEEFYQGLMRCYGMLAQPAKAMLVYDRLRQTLSAELGVTPSSASEGLARKLQEECPVASGRISPSQSVENP